MHSNYQNTPTGQQRINPNRVFQPAQQTKMDQATNGQVYVNTNTYNQLQEINGGDPNLYVLINGYVVKTGVCDDFVDNSIALNKFQRQVFRIDMVNPVNIQVFKPPADKEFKLANLKFEIECIQISPQLKGSKFEIDDSEFISQFRKHYQSQYFRAGQILLQVYQNSMFTMKISEAGNFQYGVKEMQELPYGLLVDETEVELSCKHNQIFGLKQASRKVKNIFVSNFKFEEMGIGGLDEELANIFRRAFAARRFPPYILKKYGITHVKGLLLYGPPGTGKTLIARKLAKALNSVEPKIVNGPEIMSAYVGKSEENIRELFQDAKNDQQSMGDDSQLHIIIFDEMDAICKSRGREAGAGGSAKDGVVNQLLSMIDGVESLNNILVIGMTNRKDLIDEAILRPGRFEVHVEISLPNEEGRQQILKIHTTDMVNNKVMHPNVDLQHLAHVTKNFTGAEIESLVKSATSFAFNRVHNIMDFNKTNLDDEVIIEMKDFQRALDEIKPAFGFDEDKFDVYLRNPLVDYGERYHKIQYILKNAIQQTKTGKSTQLNSVLLEGNIGTGKTAIAAWAGKQCEFPFVQIISPENFVGFSENGKINAIVKVFEDAYKSPLSCIILDNIERLIEYIDIGPRFSNGLLQAILVLIKKIPKKEDSRLLIIGTTNQARILKELEITAAFNIAVNIPCLQSKEIIPFLQKFNISQQDQVQISNSIHDVPVKQLQMILDMLSVENQETNRPITVSQFMECYDAINLDKM